MLPFHQKMAQQMAKNNPLFQRAMKMAEGKTQEECRQIAQNLCNSRGIEMDKAFDVFKAQMQGGMNR